MPSYGDVRGVLEAAAGKYRLDPSLLAGVWDFESGFDPRAVNRSSGATGLGQVMPREAGFPDRPTQAELMDPATNAEWSARILRSGLDRYGSEDKALAAYLGAIDARGNITGATDANGTGGNAYIRTVRERQRKYGGDRSVNLLAANDGDPDWYREWIASQRAPQRTTLPQDGAGDPDWYREAVAAGKITPGAQGAQGASASRGEGGTGGTAWPVAGAKPGAVTNPFGAGQARSAGATIPLPATNHGADLAGRYGQTVVAPVDGLVVGAFDAPNETDRNLNHGWGGSVLIQGADGYTHRLSHQQPGLLVRPGQRVAAGDPIGRIGMSGNTTGPHLDWEKFAGPDRFVDPVATAGGVSSPSKGAGTLRPTTSADDPDWYREWVATLRSA